MDEFMPEELRDKIPTLYRTGGEADPMVWVKFFSPVSNWQWYIVEYGEEAGVATFYGWLVSKAEQQGRFIRSDLASIRAYFGVTITRDPDFAPCRLSQVQYEKGALLEAVPQKLLAQIPQLGEPEGEQDPMVVLQDLPEPPLDVGVAPQTGMVQNRGVIRD
jgi:hypothetical protein